jgi:hypothetical protein
MPAQKPVRMAHLISPFGVGSMVDFPGDEALISAGLDVWPLADQHCPPAWQISEERLQERLGVTHFRQPPDYRDPGPGVQNAAVSVPFLRFPRYHYCPGCGGMKRLSPFGGRVRCSSDEPGGCASLPERKRRFLIPMRIVAACANGHLEDVPLLEWVHGRGTIADTAHQLKYVAGGTSAALSGIVIKCSCGRSRSLSGIFNFSNDSGGALLQTLGWKCSGGRPWLGENSNEAGCSEPLRVIQRGASNVYFPVTVSSIYLPLWAEEADSPTIKALEDSNVWSTLTSGLIDGTRIDPMRCEVVAQVRQLDARDLQAAAQRKLDGVAMSAPASEEDYRRHEYDAFRDGRGVEPSDLRVDIVPGELYRGLSRFVRAVGLVRRLRETRVLAGFSRLFPAQDETDRRVQSLSSRTSLPWLPAIVVRGEGIYIELDGAGVAEWQNRADVATHLGPLMEAQAQRDMARGLPVRVFPPKLILLHTFAHVLIRQLSNDCGYGSAALRERIYCETNDAVEPMQGILIYTASGDSEGTMGGLVRQGEPTRLEYTIERALERARWCSADPICLETSGHRGGTGNLAACHSCALLPETSCEHANKLLDRQVLIGRPDSPELGYFRRPDQD